MTLYVWVRIVHVPPCCSYPALQKPFNARTRQVPMSNGYGEIARQHLHTVDVMYEVF